VDIVFQSEGVYALHNLLRSNIKSDIHRVAGISYKSRDGQGTSVVFMNPPQWWCRISAWKSICRAMPGPCCPIASFR
jgi:hypothetical protein